MQPIHYAALCGHVSTVMDLITKYDADPEAKSSVCTCSLDNILSPQAPVLMLYALK